MPAPETYYDVAMRQLEEQIDGRASLDTKAGTVLGAATALVPIFGALVAAFNRDISAVSIALYAVAFAIYLSMIFLIVRAARTRGWSLRPDLETLRSYAKEYDDRTVRMWIAEECRRSVETNEPILRRKALFVDLSLAALVLVAVALSAAALLELLS